MISGVLFKFKLDNTVLYFCVYSLFNINSKWNVNNNKFKTVKNDKIPVYNLWIMARHVHMQLTWNSRELEDIGKGLFVPYCLEISDTITIVN